MKRFVYTGMLSILLAVGFAASGHAGGYYYGGYRGGGWGYRGGVWIGVGPGWWGPPVYPYYVAPPVVIQQQPQVYVQPQQTEPNSYWYYCQDPQGYYPYVKQCPSGWMKVVPTPVPPGMGE